MVKTVSVDSQKALRCKKEAPWTFIKLLEISSDLELFTGHHFIIFQSIYIYLMVSKKNILGKQAQPLKQSILKCEEMQHWKNTLK